MKKWFLHILLLVGLFGMLTTSCSQDEGLESQASDEKVQVMFTIALDGPSARSRATWGDTYDSAIGNDFDNYIDPDKFYVKLVIGNTSYDVQNIVTIKESDNVYKFMGEVSVTATSLTDAKIMVYANMDVDENGAIVQTFTPNYSINPGTGVKYIPMWGVHTITQAENLSLTPGSCTELQSPIYLLRAMAKVEVNLSAKGFTLTGLSLNRYKTKGNCLPANANTVANTEALSYNSTDQTDQVCFNPASDGASTQALSFNVSNDHLVFYLPEVANATGNDELVMTLSLKKGDQDITLNAPYLYFRQYTSGKADNANPFDVVRNHWYQYNITTINDAIGASLDVKVNQWNEDEEIWDYREQVSVEDDGKMQWLDVKENETDNDFTVNIDTNKKEVYVPVATKDNPAVCTFRLSTPAGGTWYASFEEQTGEYGAFKFLQTTTVDGKETTTEVTSVSGKVGELATLRIITTNTTPTVTSTAKLRIAVRSSDGSRTIIVKELVPNSTNAEYTLVQSQQ